MGAREVARRLVHDRMPARQLLIMGARRMDNPTEKDAAAMARPGLRRPRPARQIPLTHQTWLSGRLERGYLR